MKLPASVVIAEVLQSRYKPGTRPSAWDKRIAGHDLVRTKDGQIIKLLSDGQQSSPDVGWGIIVRAGSEDAGYSWTLFALPNSREASDSAAGVSGSGQIAAAKHFSH